MGGTWYPYLVGIVLGHLGTLFGWGFTAVVEALVSILKRDNSSAIKLIDQVPPYPSSAESSTWTTTTSSVGSGFRNLGSFPSLDKAGDNEGNLWWVIVLAVISWSVAILLGAILWVRQHLTATDEGPGSPSLGELARLQLAEVRLRTHGIGR